MSKAFEATETLPRPGDKNPDNPKQVWVECDLCSEEGRWITTAMPLNLKATSFKKRGRKCAARELTRQHPEARQGRRKTLPDPLPSGSTLHWKTKDFTCGICGVRHQDAGLSAGINQTGFCKGCKPWVAVTLLPEHYKVASPERHEVYAKIKRIREMLEQDATKIPGRPEMPFWALVKRFVGKFPETDPRLPTASQSSLSRHLVLFFEDEQVGRIVPESATKFTDNWLGGINRLGARSASTARTVLDLLRRMLGFAKEQGWIRENPFPKNAALGPSIPSYKDDRIMTLEEEEGLHAACVVKFAYLRALLIYVADAPAYLRDFLKLRWDDVDFEGNLIPGRRGLVEMTPRLSTEMRSLWELPDRQPEVKVISRTIHQCNYDFEKVRATAGVEGLKWADIRRTGAWRMERAGRRLEQIAAALGMSHLDNVRELLKVNPMMAQREIASPRFQQFIREQFQAGKVPVEVQRLLKAVNAVVDRWKEVRGYSGSLERRLKMVGQLEIAPALDIPLDEWDDKMNRTRVKRELNKLGVETLFPGSVGGYPAFRKAVVDEFEDGATREAIASRLFQSRQSP